MTETERGCGWRQVGGVYLVGTGIKATCDALPIPLKDCPTCGFEVKFSRSIQAVHAGYMAALLSGHVCQETFACPICYYARVYPDLAAQLSKKERRSRGVPSLVYFMFVSKKFYTPEGFIQEANTQGISKRIAPNSLPRTFVLGQDWVYLVHNEVPIRAIADDQGAVLKTETVHKRAIFYGFRPQRIEIILWADTPQAKIDEYEAAGYAPVLIEKTEENMARHGEREREPPDLVQDYEARRRARALKKVSQRAPKHGPFKDARPALPFEQGAK